MKENKYSIKDLCNIFNINTNTFPSVAKRLNINTEEFYTTETNEYNSSKKYYNELAYKKIEEYALSKEKNKVVKEKEVSKYLQKIEDKEKSIEDLRKQLDFTQKLLIAEKGEKQQLQQQIFLLSEGNKKISELEVEKYKLQKEVERLNNRNFFARLFDK